MDTDDFNREQCRGRWTEKRRAKINSKRKKRKAEHKITLPMKTELEQRTKEFAIAIIKDIAGMLRSLAADGPGCFETRNWG